MTVRKLVEILSEYPDDADVTDMCGNPIYKICFDPEAYNVWIDCNYIYPVEDDLK